MIRISLKMKPIKGSKRWQPENGRAVIKPITTAPLSWLAQGRLGAKVKNKYMDKTQATKPPSTKAKAVTFFWRASAHAQNAFAAHHTTSALGLQKNDASQPLPIFRGMDFHGALRKKQKNVWDSSQNLCASHSIFATYPTCSVIPQIPRGGRL